MFPDQFKCYHNFSFDATKQAIILTVFNYLIKFEWLLCILDCRTDYRMPNAILSIIVCEICPKMVNIRNRNIQGCLLLCSIIKKIFFYIKDSIHYYLGIVHAQSCFLLFSSIILKILEIEYY